MSPQPPTLIFKLLAALGALALLALFAAPFFFFKVVDHAFPSAGPSTSFEVKLGEFGATCGGSSLLPCKSGLTCSADPQVKESIGVCIK